MINNAIQKRWVIFTLGVLVGVGLLVACASATQTATPPPAAATQPSTGAQPATEAPTTGPAAETPVQTTEGGSLLDEVIARGVLRCGVNSSLPGFGAIDESGNNVGFDVDFCRAIAAAVLGDATKVEFTTLNADQRFPALQTGQIDVLIRNTTWTLTRDADLGLDFTVTTFYDGQGYIVRGDEFKSVADLAGGTICVTSGTTTEGNLADDFARRGLDYTAQVFSETANSWGTFVSGACDAYTSDKSQLASLASAEPDPSIYTILPDTISKEPLGPVVRQNDSKWRDAVMWTVYAMVQAEELGINQANVDTFMSSDKIEVQRLLGTGDTNLGDLLGLPTDYGYQIIKQVGNYGDVYDRYLPGIGIQRDGSLNALWTNGGLIYAPADR